MSRDSHKFHSEEKMSVLRLTVLVVVVFVTAIAQEADKCDTPEKWEGYEVRIDTGSERYPGGVRRSFISYDSVDMKFNRVDEMRSPNQSTQYYREIFLHMEKIGYRINLRTNDCERFSLTEPFRKIGVPSTDTLAYKAIIGSSADFGAGIEVNGYTDNTERGRYVGEWIQPGEYNQCVPAFESYISRISGGHVYTSFYNITLGISNPTVFVPPTECT